MDGSDASRRTYHGHTVGFPRALYRSVAKKLFTARSSSRASSEPPDLGWGPAQSGAVPDEPYKTLQSLTAHPVADDSIINLDDWLVSRSVRLQSPLRLANGVTSADPTNWGRRPGMSHSGDVRSSSPLCHPLIGP